MQGSAIECGADFVGRRQVGMKSEGSEVPR